MNHRSRYAAKLLCINCNNHNSIDVWPLNGDSVPFYFEAEKGDYWIEVFCQHCGENWYVVWDYDPGPILQLSTDEEFEDENKSYKGSYKDPMLYFTLKSTVEKVLHDNNYEFDELFKLFKESYQGVFEMNKIFPLFKRAWNELKNQS